MTPPPKEPKRKYPFRPDPNPSEFPPNWEFNIWINEHPPTESVNYVGAVKLRSYKRPHFVTRALPNIMAGFKAYIEVRMKGDQIRVLLGDDWLPMNQGVSEIERYFADMMEKQREYERWQEPPAARKRGRRK